MAVNTSVVGNVATTEFSYGSASEALRVAADGTYRWKSAGKAVQGRRVPSPDGPGIVLQRALGGVDWTLRNESNATTENIRGLQSARLTAAGKASVSAKRPLRP
ncbi:hypothetical protein [Deinococcus radiotolerans]|uniref:Uncharacterized protein n=1 Tax=Deinococcus radiotolerans TaxID=1309407 RepID=A0ABQ2FPW3_9DEIO|nr:hypothetical protein [Deinococcus radiotolerans]GGL15324.1 hypothetical protein GCM10010844_37660 [Deinococcus radiotolerans]